MSVITLLKDFTFAGEQGELLQTDWVPFPAGIENAQLVVIVKNRLGSSALDLALQASWDTDTAETIPASLLTTGGPGTTIMDITSGLGPLVRFWLLASSMSDSQVTLSVYLTPKKN